MAVMEHSKSIGSLIKDLNEQKNEENKTNDANDKNEEKKQDLTQEERQNLAAYYYYLSLASLSAVTSTVASSVYQRLPTKESIASLGSSVSNIMRYGVYTEYIFCLNFSFFLHFVFKKFRRSKNNSPNNELNSPNKNDKNDKNDDRSSTSWLRNIQKLISNTKAEKEAIDRVQFA